MAYVRAHELASALWTLVAHGVRIDGCANEYKLVGSKLKNNAREWAGIEFVIDGDSSASAHVGDISMILTGSETKDEVEFNFSYSVGRASLGAQAGLKRNYDTKFPVPDNVEGTARLILQRVLVALAKDLCTMESLIGTSSLPRKHVHGAAEPQSKVSIDALWEHINDRVRQHNTKILERNQKELHLLELDQGQNWVTLELSRDAQPSLDDNVGCVRVSLLDNHAVVDVEDAKGKTVYKTQHKHVPNTAKLLLAMVMSAIARAGVLDKLLEQQ